MKLSVHIVTSAVAGAAVYAATRSVPGAAACLLWGVLIDLDHLLDYGLCYGPRFDRRHFFDACYGAWLPRIILVLHAWEFVPVLLFWVWRSGSHPVAVGSLVGYTFHMTLDQIGNRPSPGGLFLLLRAAHGFARSFFFPNRPPPPACERGRW